MKRGDVWIVAGGPDYAGKPRPVAILQSDAFGGTASVTICPLTTHLVDSPLIRLPVEPTKQNGLLATSHLMVDKISTVAKARLQKRIGRLADEDLLRLNRAGLVFLGFAGRATDE